jgi:hypothetical protein
MLLIREIGDSASFWASIATLWGASGAWFTYREAEKATRNQEDATVRNLLIGMKKELEFIRSWASGEEGNVGYLESKTEEELAAEYRSWYDPRRLIFGFECPTIKNVTRSQNLVRLSPVLNDLLALNHSIRQVFDVYEEYRRYAFAYPQLYRSVVDKLNNILSDNLAPQDPAFSEEERAYLHQIFKYNKTIHQRLIGGLDSKDQSVLYKTFRRAEASINVLLKEPESKAEPLLHRTLTFIAWGLVFLGVVLVFEWFGTNIRSRAWDFFGG